MGELWIADGVQDKNAGKATRARGTARTVVATLDALKKCRLAILTPAFGRDRIPRSRETHMLSSTRRNLLLSAACALTFFAAPSATDQAAAADAPARVTCSDGTTSKSGQGACSHHGGVSTTLPAPPAGSTGKCEDGTFTQSQQRSGACSQHGGVAEWFGSK
jgi:hypothetical protein